MELLEGGGNLGGGGVEASWGSPSLGVCVYEGHFGPWLLCLTPLPDHHEVRNFVLTTVPKQWSSPARTKTSHPAS